MEKEFNLKSTWDSRHYRYHFIGPLILMIILLIMLAWFYHIPGLLWIGLLVVSIFFIVGSINFFFVKIAKDKLILQNRLWNFWRREFLFTEVKEIGLEGGEYYANSYIETRMVIRMKDKRARCGNYIIGCVEKKDYKEIIELILEKGVNINLDRLGERWKSDIGPMDSPPIAIPRLVNDHGEQVFMFRQPFFKMRHFDELSLTCAGIMLLGIILYAFFQETIMLLLVLVPGLIFLIGSYVYFYIILTKDRLIMQNRIFPFWKRTLLYRELEEVKITSTYTSTTLEYFCHRDPLPKRCPILAIDVSDRSTILHILREKGVKVGIG